MDFGITETELTNLIGKPDETRGGELTFDFYAVYYDFEKDGISSYEYEMVPDYPIYKSLENILETVKVIFIASQDNLSFMLNWLTNKYGTPRHEPTRIFSSYLWEKDNLTIELEYLKKTMSDEIISLELEYSDD